MGTDQQTAADVVVVGGGQAALAAGYYLQRANRDLPSGRDPLRFVLLDQRGSAGGAWSDGWQSLRLFSPAAYSSLPGWAMPPEEGGGDTPAAEHVRRYLEAYEQRYQLPVQRPVAVTTVERHGSGGFRVVTDRGAWSARVVINATGTWGRPFWPRYPGMSTFRGRQLHTQHYRRAGDFDKARVVVVGGGNSAAQIAADLAGRREGTVTWTTLRPPRYLPDDVDGRALFDIATRAVRNPDPTQQQGVASLGDIVAVPTVRDARDRGLLQAQPMFDRLTPAGVAWDAPSRQVDADVIIWCTGFRPDLAHLAAPGLRRHQGHPVTDPELPTRSVDEPRLFFLGYGDWCGAASATLIGVGPAARATVAAVLTELGNGHPGRR